MRTHHPGEAPAADRPRRTATPAPRPHAAISRSAVGSVPGGRGQPPAAPVTEGMGTHLRWDICHVVVVMAARPAPPCTTCSAAPAALSRPGQGGDRGPPRRRLLRCPRARRPGRPRLRGWIRARAYTSGSHVVMAMAAPAASLAHELTHVVRRRSGPVVGTGDGDGPAISDPSDRFEREPEAHC